MDDQILKELESLSDEALMRIHAASGWTNSIVVPSDNESELLSVSPLGKNEDQLSREQLQTECWRKFIENPQINTAVRGMVGRLTGWGFETTSRHPEIQAEIDSTIVDFRNRLYSNWSKNVGRSFIEGELHLCFTVHEDGFVEIDFLDPATISDGEVTDGIIFHPMKSTMPLVYCVDPNAANEDDPYFNKEKYQIPSIYVARDPKLINEAAKHKGFDEKRLAYSKSPKSVYKPIGGFFRFIVSWDRSYHSKRNVSYLRTVLKWLNHYEQLKLYEIDHKKSVGAFVWVAMFDTWKTYRLFLAMSDEEKRQTGLGSKLTPGGRLFLPPGITLEAKHPQLPNISESDTDILHMVTSGLNEPEDVSTGQSKGTFASVKASRGPMSDRVSDEIAWHDRYYRYDFWGNIFFLKSKVSSFPEFFTVKEVVEFGEGGEPKEGNVKKRPEDLIEISYPTSETVDLESRAKTWLGVKHGSTNDTLGISNDTIARKLGIQNYHRERLKAETEKKRYPELIPTVDAETMQEQTEAEPSPTKIVKRNRTVTPQKKEKI